MVIVDTTAVRIEARVGDGQTGNGDTDAVADAEHAAGGIAVDRQHILTGANRADFLVHSSITLRRLSIALQPVKLVAGNRAVGEYVLVGHDHWCSRYGRPTVRGDDIGHGLKREIAVVRLPRENRVGVEL